MIEHVELLLRGDCQVSPQTLVLAAVSGGADSLYLLHALHQMGQPAAAAHLDHALRPDSPDDAAAVRAQARRLGIEFVEQRVDVAALAQAEKLSIEEAARVARYAFLFETAARLGAGAVATGHTANDQAETVLMHLLRGAGPSGLRGMRPRSLPNPWSAGIPLVRPLLSTWRTDIDAFLLENDLQPQQDSTNRDRRFYRNRLRLETLPYLEELAPGAAQRLVQMAELLGAEDDLLNQLTDAAWTTCEPLSGPDWVTLDAGRLLEQPAALQRRVLRRAIAALRPGLRDIDAAAIEAGRAFLFTPTRSGRRDLISNLHLRMEGPRLVISGRPIGQDTPTNGWPQISAAAPLSVPGEMHLPGGWRITAQRLPAAAEHMRLASANPNPWRAYLDASALNGPLVVQPHQPGDRFAPLGLGGHTQKLSDTLINHKIPRAARSAWPVLFAGQQVVWVMGVALSEFVRLGPESLEVIVVEIDREMGQPA